MKWTEHETGAHNDPKMRKLLRKHGGAAYGVYWLLVELIGEPITKDREDNGFLPDEIDSEYLALELAMEEGEVETIIEYMVQIDLFQRFEGRLFCEAILSRCDEYTRKSLRRVSGECPESVRTPSGENLKECGHPSVSVSNSSRELGEHREIAIHYAQRHFKKTGFPLRPTEREFAKAAEVSRQLGGDVGLAVKAVDAYWDQDWWFTADKKHGKPARSFASFAAHAAEQIVPTLRDRSPPQQARCGRCGAQMTGLTCDECGWSEDMEQ